MSWRMSIFVEIDKKVRKSAHQKYSKHSCRLS